MKILVRRDGGGWPRVTAIGTPDAVVVELSDAAAVAYCQMGSRREKESFLENYLTLIDSNRAVEEKEKAHRKALKEEWLREHPDSPF